VCDNDGPYRHQVKKRNLPTAVIHDTFFLKYSRRVLTIRTPTRQCSAPFTGEGVATGAQLSPMSTLPPLPTKNKGGDQASGQPALPWQPRKTSHSPPMAPNPAGRFLAPWLPLLALPQPERYLEVAHPGQVPVPGTPLGRPNLAERTPRGT
jgi:hypothetical protein